MRLKITWPEPGASPSFAELYARDVSNYKRAQANAGDLESELAQFVADVRAQIQKTIDERKISSRGLPGGIVRVKLSLEEKAKRLVEQMDSGTPSNELNKNPETSFPSNPSLGHP